MPKYIAFLRAINVGGHTVKMDHLRKMFEKIGFDNVETFIASGNVLFDAKARSAKTLERLVEDALKTALGYQVATFIRTPAELAEVAQYKPFKKADLEAAGNGLYITFVADAPSRESQKKLLSFTSAVDEFHVAGREVYWLCRQKISESKFSGALLEKTLGMSATMRNSTTVRKIAALCS